MRTTARTTVNYCKAQRALREQRELDALDCLRDDEYGGEYDISDEELERLIAPSLRYLRSDDDGARI